MAVEDRIIGRVLFPMICEALDVEIDDWLSVSIEVEAMTPTYITLYGIGGRTKKFTMQYTAPNELMQIIAKAIDVPDDDMRKITVSTGYNDLTISVVSYFGKPLESLDWKALLSEAKS